MQGYIYTLASDLYGGIFYVGSTINPSSRKSLHLANHKTSCIVFEIVESFSLSTKKELRSIEHYWIEQFRQWGFQIQNRLNNISFKRKDSATVAIHLKEVPQDVLRIIRIAKLRFEILEDKNLKQEFVIYEMLREWYRLKSIETESAANKKN